MQDMRTMPEPDVETSERVLRDLEVAFDAFTEAGGEVTPELLETVERLREVGDRGDRGMRVELPAYARNA